VYPVYRRRPRIGHLEIFLSGWLKITGPNLLALKTQRKAIQKLSPGATAPRARKHMAGYVGIP
jgi:hypothetical protein